MIFNRQKYLLALLDAHSCELGNLDFQKLLFLYCQEAASAPYEFVPYRYGGFSFTSYADKRRLIAQGLLQDQERCWKLTAAGRKAAQLPPAIREQIANFVQRHATLRGDALVAHAYRRYPYYATRSDMAARVLAKDKVALRAVETARPTPIAAGLYTIGYEGRSLEAYLNLLITSSVTLLCDVRRNPLSRKYGFSKTTLSKSCEAVGIRYQHLPELGIPGENRRSLETQADYDALFVDYERRYLPKQNAALDQIEHWITSGERVALTCYEHLPQQCHRHCVAEAIGDRLGKEDVIRNL